MQYQVVIENFSKHFKNCSCLVRKMLNQSKYFNIKRTESNTFCIGERGGGAVTPILCKFTCMFVICIPPTKYETGASFQFELWKEMREQEWGPEF